MAGEQKGIFQLRKRLVIVLLHWHKVTGTAVIVVIVLRWNKLRFCVCLCRVLPRFHANTSSFTDYRARSRSQGTQVVGNVKRYHVKYICKAPANIYSRGKQVVVLKRFHSLGYSPTSFNLVLALGSAKGAHKIKDWTVLSCGVFYHLCTRFLDETLQCDYSSESYWIDVSYSAV